MNYQFHGSLVTKASWQQETPQSYNSSAQGTFKRRVSKRFVTQKFTGGGGKNAQIPIAPQGFNGTRKTKWVGGWKCGKCRT